MKTMKRMKTRDVAFGFRMGAGFAGDVNRTHPASIEPAKIDITNPVTLFGQPVLVNTSANSVRKFIAGDTAVTKIYGVSVRPYPFQTPSTTNYGDAAFGGGVAPEQGVVDVLRDGYIMAAVPAGQTTTKQGSVFIWVTANSGLHVQGGFETVASGANTIAISNAYFNGPPDASGICELQVNVA